MKPLASVSQSASPMHVHTVAHFGGLKVTAGVLDVDAKLEWRTVRTTMESSMQHATPVAFVFAHAVKPMPVLKSQGLTLESAQIGLGTKEFCSGLTFVALPRAKALDKLMLVDQVTYDRVKNLGGKGLQNRLQDFARRYPSA